MLIQFFSKPIYIEDKSIRFAGSGGIMSLYTPLFSPYLRKL